MRRVVLLLVVVALSATAAACGGSEPAPATTQAPAGTTEAPPATTEAGSTTVAPPTTQADECAKESLPLKQPGVLTIATGNPAYPPWFAGGTQTKEWKLNDPSTGKGYESAVAYALADRLGFAHDEVKWVPTSFNESIAPGPKDYDFNMQQIGITKKRMKAVDFSDGYFDNVQAVVTTKGSKIDGATTLAELKDAKFGVPLGTTSYDFVNDYIKPSQDPAVFDDQNGAVQALKNGQVDGIVSDLYTAFYIRDAQLDNGVIVGQFPSVGETEQFGLAFEKGSGLVSCVNKALGELKDDGTLQQIQSRWLAKAGQAPVISG